jgi:hypothetical protein
LLSTNQTRKIARLSKEIQNPRLPAAAITVWPVAGFTGFHINHGICADKVPAGQSLQNQGSATLNGIMNTRNTSTTYLT